jgi:hypothetical protein
MYIKNVHMPKPVKHLTTKCNQMPKHAKQKDVECINLKAKGNAM